MKKTFLPFIGLTLAGASLFASVAPVQHHTTFQTTINTTPKKPQAPPPPPDPPKCCPCGDPDYPTCTPNTGQ